MCIIIYGDTKNFNSKVLERGYQSNKNGFGLFYFNAEKNKIVSDKIYPKNIKQVKRLFNKHKNFTDKIAVHFRYATNGELTKFNSHPFKVVSNEKIEMYLMHNSPTLPSVLKNKKYSDTYFFTQQFLKPIIENDPNLIKRKDFKNTLRKIINVECDSRILLIDTITKKFNKIGNWQFNKEFNLHVSNSGLNSYSYSYLPIYNSNSWERDEFEFNQSVPKTTKTISKISYDDSNIKSYSDSNKNSFKETENSINEIVDIFCSGDIDEILEILKEYPNLSARVIKEFLQNNSNLTDTEIEKIAKSETEKANTIIDSDY